MEVMAMEAIVVDTVDIEATMARGMLRPLLMLPLMPLLMLSLGTMATVDMVLDMDMVATDSVDTEDTTARGRLRPRLNPDMATDTDVDTDMVAMDVSMEAMVDTAEDTMARGRLMPRLSPDMATDTDVDTDMVAMVMAVPMEDMGMEEDTMDKFHPITSFHTATFILVLKLSLVLLQNFLK